MFAMPNHWLNSFPLFLPRNSISVVTVRYASSSSSTKWKQRQGTDVYAREARVQGLKSRAAFKLLELDSKYRLFKKGQTVVDLGYAPGSWSQVAVERTKPSGRVVGIDLIPASPPRGVATFQGDFLSPTVQKLVRDYLQASHREQSSPTTSKALDELEEGAVAEPLGRSSYIRIDEPAPSRQGQPGEEDKNKKFHPVDIVLSDMSEPWEQISGFASNTLSNPYRRLMNTSGSSFRDHAGSMDLCAAAIQFASDTLKTGGSFVCKFYQGREDKTIEANLKKLFSRVYREKPEASRSESKEAYFVALRRRPGVTVEDILS